MYAHMWHGLAHSLMDFLTHAHFPGISEAIYVVAYIKKASPISEKKLTSVALNRNYTLQLRARTQTSL